jgi:tol-pal system protein YbgF
MRNLACLLLLGGCGGEALVRAQMADMQKKLDETQRRAATAERKAEDLQDQVFLLTDKLESQKIAHAAAPKLPVVLLTPPEPKDEPEDEVAFEGAARSKDPSHTRPSLVLNGAPPPKFAAKSEGPAVEKRAAGTAGENIGVAPAPPIAAGNAVQLYKEGQEALRAGHHDQAAKIFRELVRRFPDHDLADNAQYWLGECFYARKQFVEALPEFRQVVARYPLGNKAPDALLKLAYCALALGDLAKGRELLKQVPVSYPNTEAARLAQARLAELGREGGTR